MAKKPQSNLGCILTGIVVLLIPIVSTAACGYGTLVLFMRLDAPEVTTQWQPSGPLPAKAVKILGAGKYGYDPVVQTNDGRRYSYTCWQSNQRTPEPDCWREVAAWEEVTPLQGIQETPKFVTPNPPGKVVDAVTILWGGELIRQTNYAILEDGSMWVWDYTGGDGVAAMVAVFLAVCGALAGLAIGATISVTIGVRAWGGQRATIYFATGIMILIIMGLLFLLRLHSL